MAPRISLIAGLAIALAGTGPAYAQLQPVTEVTISAESGPAELVAETSSGFRLLEHGIWQRTIDATNPIPSEREGSRDPLSYHYPQGTRGGPSGFRRASYLPYVRAAELRYALPTGLLDALVWTESRYNPVAVSKAGAAGLGQLMPGTARDLGVANRFDPHANIDGAARYLRQMLDKFRVVHLALAAYNAGPGAVERAQGIPRNRETLGYVRKVLRYWQLAHGG